jgi:hypothetical protein
MEDFLFAAGLVVFGIVLAFAIVLGSYLGAYKAHEKYDQDRNQRGKRP